MAGDWIPACKNLTRKREVLAISASAGLSRREVVGTLLDFWCWADGETRDGSLPGLTVSMIGATLDVSDGFLNAMISVGWLKVEDGALHIPNFDRWMGKEGRRKAADRVRKRSVRKMSASEADGLRTDVALLSRKKCDTPPPSSFPSSFPLSSPPITPLTISQPSPFSSPPTNFCSEPLNAAAEPTVPTAAEMPKRDSPKTNGDASPAGDRDPVVLTFPCVGPINSPREWHLRESKLREYAEAYPAVDVLLESRKALQWCRDNPTKRKTCRGSAAFLTRWLAKAQDRGGNGKAIPRSADSRGETIAQKVARLSGGSGG